MSRLLDRIRKEAWDERREYGLEGKRPAKDKWCLRRWAHDGDMPSSFWDAAIWYERQLEMASGIMGSAGMSERVQGGSNGQERALLAKVEAGNERSRARMAVIRFVECEETVRVFDALFLRFNDKGELQVDDKGGALMGRPTLDLLTKHFHRRKGNVKVMATFALEGLATFLDRRAHKHEWWRQPPGSTAC